MSNSKKVDAKAPAYLEITHKSGCRATPHKGEANIQYQKGDVDEFSGETKLRLLAYKWAKLTDKKTVNVKSLKKG